MVATRLAKIQARMTVAERVIFDQVPGSTDAEKLRYLLEHRTLSETIREGVREEVALSLGKSALMLKGSLESPESPFTVSVRKLDQKLDQLLDGQRRAPPKDAAPGDETAARDQAQASEPGKLDAAEITLRKALVQLIDVGINEYAEGAQQAALVATKSRLMDRHHGTVPVVASVFAQVIEIFMQEQAKGQEAHALLNLTHELESIAKR